MEQYLAQGVAERTVCNFIHYCLKEGIVSRVLDKYYDAVDIALIRHEIESIAMAHERRSEYYKFMQEHNGAIIQDAIDSTEDRECVQLRIDPESTPPHQVLWEALGYFLTFATATPGEAIALYEALQRIREVEAD